MTDDDERDAAQQPDAAPDAETAQPQPPRWRRISRRMGRGKTGAALAAAVAGVLAGSGVTAWQADALPFTGDDACWGSLSEGDLEDLPLGDGGIAAQEQTPGDGLNSDGQCRLTGDAGRGWEVNVRVHTPTGPYSDDTDGWYSKFLSSDMSPLGGDLTGMASAPRAWLALPEKCTNSTRHGPPAVVDVDTGGSGLGTSDDDAERRAVLARVVTRLANGAMEKLGCDDRFEQPGDLPAVPPIRDVRSGDALCGVDGLTVPSSAEDAPEQERRSGGGGPVRSCDLGYSDLDVDDLRLLTVADTRLARVLDPVVRDSGVPVRGGKNDYGTLGATNSAFRTKCRTGEVVFLLYQKEIAENPLRTARTLLPRYAAAEAERLGCTPPKMKLPDVP